MAPLQGAVVPLRTRQASGWQRARIRTTGSFAAILMVTILASAFLIMPASATITNICAGSTISSWAPVASLGTSTQCLIVHDGYFYDSSLLEGDPQHICGGSTTEDYVYIDFGTTEAISTLVLMTDIRNNVGFATAPSPEIKVCFSNNAPRASVSDDEIVCDWMQYSYAQSKLIDITAVSSRYLHIKYECPTGGCYMVQLHQVACYAEQRANLSAFNLAVPGNEITGAICQHTDISFCEWSPISAETTLYDGIDNADSALLYVQGVVFVPSIHLGQNNPTFESSGLSFDLFDLAGQPISGGAFISPVVPSHLIELGFSVPVIIEQFAVSFDSYVVGTTVQGFFLLQSIPCTSVETCDKSCISLGSQGAQEDIVLQNTFSFTTQYSRSFYWAEACDSVFNIVNTTTDTQGMVALQVESGSEEETICQWLVTPGDLSVVPSTVFDVVFEAQDAATGEVLYTITSTQTYENPCESTTFTKGSGGAIIQDGILYQMQIALSPSMQLSLFASDLLYDTGSALDAGDGWSLCAPFRTYTVDTSLSTSWVDETSVTVAQGVNQFLTFSTDPTILEAGDYIMYFDVSMDIFGANVDSKSGLQVLFSATMCKFADETRSGETVHTTIIMQTRQNDFRMEVTGESLSTGHSCNSESYALSYTDDLGNTIAIPAFFEQVSAYSNGQLGASRSDVLITSPVESVGLTYIIVETYTIYYDTGGVVGAWVHKRPFTWIDECNDPSASSIQIFTVSDMETSLLRPETETTTDFNWMFPDDNSPSLHFGDDDKYNFDICGKILVDIIHDGASSEFFSITYDQGVLVDPETYYLSLSPTVLTHIGTFNVALSVYYEDYPGIAPVELPIEIVVLPCEVKEYRLVDPDNPPDYTYETYAYASPLVIDVRDTWLVYPACNTFYTEELTLTISPEPISEIAVQDPIDNKIIIVETEDIFTAGTYTFVQTMTFTDYDSELGTEYFSTTMSVQIIDPCLLTVLQPSFTIEHLHAIVGSNQPLQFTWLTFTDVFSLGNDEDGSGVVSCLARLTSIAEMIQTVGANWWQVAWVSVPDPTFLTLTMGEVETSVKYIANDSSLAGHHGIQVSSWLEYYPIITASATLNITFYDAINDLEVEPQTYMIGQPMLEIQLPRPEFHPSLHHSENEQTGENGGVLRYEIQVKNGASLSDFPEGLGTFEDGTKRLIIEPTEDRYVGVLQIRVTYHGQDYIANQSLYTDFQLTIQAEPVDFSDFYLVPIPFFEPTEQDLFEIEVGEGWFYDIPKGLHTDPTVDVALFKVELGKASTFLKYDLLDRSLQVYEGTTDNEVAGTYLIIFQLLDSNGVTSGPKTIVLTIFPDSDGDDSDSEEEVTEESTIGSYYADLLEQRNQLEEKSKRNQLDNSEIGEKGPPIAEFASMDNYGNIQVTFSKPMVIIPEVSDLSSSGIKLAKTTPQQPSMEPAGTRLLSSPKKKDESFKVKLEIISLKVEPGDFSDEIDLGFSWKVTKFTEKALNIQVSFNKPVYVSANAEPDFIEMKFLSEDFFFDEDGFSLSDETTFLQRLPKQYADPGLQEALEKTEQALKSSTQTVLAFNLAINILLSASLQYLWEMINAQQIVVLLPLCNIQIPDNAAIIFNSLMTVAAVEAIPTDTIYEGVFGAAPIGRAINQNFEQVGLEHHLLMNNFGSLGFVLLVIGPCIYASYYIGTCFNCKSCRRYTNYMKDKLFFNTLLRMTIESYVIGLICIFLNVRDLELKSDDKWTLANSILTIIFLPIFLLFPLFSLKIMYYSRGSMKDRKSEEGKKFHSSYGELFEGYNTGESKMIFFWFIEYLRKIMLACVVVFTQKHLWLQLFVIYNSSIFLIIASGYIEVRNSKYGDRMDKFNEIKIIFILYHLMLFTMLVPDPETKFQIGYSCAFFVCAGVIINMSDLVTHSTKLLKRKSRLGFHMKRAKRAGLDRSKRPSPSSFVMKKKMVKLNEYNKLQRYQREQALMDFGFSSEAAKKQCKALFTETTMEEYLKLLKENSIQSNGNKVLPKDITEDALKRKKVMDKKASKRQRKIAPQANDDQIKSTRDKSGEEKPKLNQLILNKISAEELEYMEKQFGITAEDLNKIGGASVANEVTTGTDNKTADQRDRGPDQNAMQEEEKKQRAPELVDQGFGAYRSNTQLMPTQALDHRYWLGTEAPRRAPIYDEILGIKTDNFESPRRRSVAEPIQPKIDINMISPYQKSQSMIRSNIMNQGHSSHVDIISKWTRQSKQQGNYLGQTFGNSSASLVGGNYGAYRGTVDVASSPSPMRIASYYRATAASNAPAERPRLYNRQLQRPSLDDNNNSSPLRIGRLDSWQRVSRDAHYN